MSMHWLGEIRALGGAGWGVKEQAFLYGYDWPLEVTYCFGDCPELVGSLAAFLASTNYVSAALLFHSTLPNQPLLKASNVSM